MLPYVWSACAHPCFFLACINKYSQNTTQAANGILALSEEELQKSPVRFLVSGWAFYPDALLTPEEIRDESHYMRYLSIGEQTNKT